MSPRRASGRVFWWFGYLRRRFDSFRRPGSRAEVRGLRLQGSDHGLVPGLSLAAVIRVGYVAVRADEYVHQPVFVALVGDGALADALSQDIDLDAKRLDRLIHRQTGKQCLAGNP